MSNTRKQPRSQRRVPQHQRTYGRYAQPSRPTGGRVAPSGQAGAKLLLAGVLGSAAMAAFSVGSPAAVPAAAAPASSGPGTTDVSLTADVTQAPGAAAPSAGGAGNATPAPTSVVSAGLPQPPPLTTVYGRLCLGLCLGGAYTNDGTNSSATFYGGIGLGGSAGVSSGAAATSGEVDLQGRASLALRPWLSIDGMAQVSQQFGTPFDTAPPQANPGVALRGTVSIGPPGNPEWWAAPGAVASWTPGTSPTVQPFLGAGYSLGMETSAVLAWSFPLPGSNSTTNAQIGTPFAVTLPDGTMLTDGIPSFPSSAYTQPWSAPPGNYVPFATTLPDGTMLTDGIPSFPSSAYAPQQSAPAPAAAPPAAPATSPPDGAQPSGFPIDGIQSWPLPATPQQNGAADIPPASPALGLAQAVPADTSPGDSGTQQPAVTPLSVAAAPVAAVDSSPDLAGAAPSTSNPSLSSPAPPVADPPAPVAVTSTSPDNSTTDTSTSTSDAAPPVITASVDPTSSFDSGTG